MFVSKYCKDQTLLKIRLIYDKPLFGGQPPLTGHLPIPRGWPLHVLNEGSTFYVSSLIFFSFRYSDFCQSPKLPENPTLRPWLHEIGTLVKYPAIIQTISLSPSKLSICSNQGEQRENAQERPADFSQLTELAGRLTIF